MVSVQGINELQNQINSSIPLTTTSQDRYKSDGFSVPAAFSADGNGLPYTKVPAYRNAKLRRNIITWFVPQFGIVRMYVNPESIRYASKKIIRKDLTKGGYTLQYWGEDLTTLTIAGTTGSSGVEGINLLYEVYRAEQYAFDATGLMIAANNYSSGSQDLASLGLNALGAESGVRSVLFGSTGSGTGLVGGLLGVDSSNNSYSNYPTLAQLAFTVEMYYDGWVYRGYFENMDFTESARDFLWTYNINFTVTQRRGYRTNYFPWHRSANNGPSQYDTPYAFSGTASVGG